jgi:NADH:ubiquinone reductase (H+-translocating)
VPYDTLIVAAGSSYSYFGHEDWRAYAAEVKTLESAITVRSRVLRAFEHAEFASDPQDRDAEMTFVIVGGGPTGVEMAGQIGELARDTLPKDFRNIDSRQARVLLIDTGERLLATFPPSLSAKAASSLEKLGVTPILNRTVVDVDARSVTISDSSGSRERIAAATVIWAAGVTASGLARQLGELGGAEVDRDGRVTVGPDLTLPGHPEILVLGDMVEVRDGSGAVQSLPGVAPVAIQQGPYAGDLIGDRLAGRSTPPFRYRNKGNVATIGRGLPVADLRLIKLSGLPAWFVWLFVHLWYLIGCPNRVLVIIQWSFSFFTHGRSSRLIVGRARASGGLSPQDQISSARRRRWQAELAADRSHRPLDRSVGGVQTRLVGVQLAQESGRRRGGCQPGSSLVNPIQRPGDQLGHGRERDSQQPAVEGALDARGATEVGLRRSEMVLVAVFEWVEGGFETAVARSGDRQVLGRQSPPRRTGRGLAVGRGSCGGCLSRRRMVSGSAPCTKQADTTTHHCGAPSGPA